MCCPDFEESISTLEFPFWWENEDGDWVKVFSDGE